MNQCRDCKHYEPWESHYGNPEGMGRCVLFSFPAAGRRLICGEDGDGYWAQLIRVSPDFGCVQFEPKEQG